MAGFILFCICFACILGWIDGGKKINNTKHYATDNNSNCFFAFFFIEK
jgi:hypothetical protein